MTYPYIAARWKRTLRPGREIKWIVLHSMEAPEKGDTAESCARFFQRTQRMASAHYCVDNNSIIQSVLDKDIAYGASGANRYGLHIEFPGFARQSAEEWRDTYSDAALSRGAWLVREKARKYSIPVRFLEWNDLRANRPGITTHAEVEKAFPSSGHWDPGPHFPIDWFMALVEAALLVTNKETMIVAMVDVRVCPLDGGFQQLQEDGSVFNSPGCGHFHGSWHTDHPVTNDERGKHPDRKFVAITDNPRSDDPSAYIIHARDGAWVEFPLPRR